MTTELERQLASLKQGDHICPIYESMAEQMASAVPFLKDGLVRGERCLYVADDHTAAQIVQALEAAGVDVAHTRARGVSCGFFPSRTSTSSPVVSLTPGK